MCCETENVITYADVSVNSEYDTILRLNHYAQIHDKPHKVILMADLGDIREGFTDYQELFEAVSYTHLDVYKRQQSLHTKNYHPEMCAVLRYLLPPVSVHHA